MWLEIAHQAEEKYGGDLSQSPCVCTSQALFLGRKSSYLVLYYISASYRDHGDRAGRGT